MSTTQTAKPEEIEEFQHYETKSKKKKKKSNQNQEEEETTVSTTPTASARPNYSSIPSWVHQHS